jgi:hypothetical protein
MALSPKNRTPCCSADNPNPIDSLAYWTGERPHTAPGMVNARQCQTSSRGWTLAPMRYTSAPVSESVVTKTRSGSISSTCSGRSAGPDRAVINP